VYLKKFIADSFIIAASLAIVGKSLAALSVYIGFVELYAVGCGCIAGKLLFLSQKIK
jgi:hypothetical protein